MYQELADMACNKITRAITEQHRDEHPIVAVPDPFNPVGSTAYVKFNTSREDRWETDARKCHVNWVILDSDWEAEFCRVAESHPRVKAYVKNHNLGLEVPYLFGSVPRRYRPDFIVLVDDGRGDDDLLHLIVEIKGYRREDAKEKKATMDTYWIPGVNHLATHGRWAFAEFTEMYQIESDFKAKVKSEFNRMIIEISTLLVVEPGSWSDVGGEGSIDPHASTLSLIVRQTPAVHWQVASLLDVLRGGHRAEVLVLSPGEVLHHKYPARLASISGHRSDIVTVTAISPTEFTITGVATGRTSFVVTDELEQCRQFDIVVSESDADTAALLNAEERIEQALNKRIELRVRQVTLEEALHIVSQQVGINIVVDEPGLNDYGVTSTSEVSLSLQNIPARTVLELLLDPLQLGFVVQDEVVLVTNQARLQGQLEAVCYDVSDLIGDAEDSVEADLEELAALLRSTVAPESWQMVGGQGSIIVIPWKKLLVVTQSPARHEAVEAVLASLRQAAHPVD